MSHVWIKSTLGHGGTMCKYCSMTFREAEALGAVMTCDSAIDTRPSAEVMPLPEATERRREPSHWGMWCESCNQHAERCDCSQPRLTRILRGRAR